MNPLWENRPNHQLLQNKIEARKVDAAIIAVGDQTFFYKEFKSSLLSQHSGTEYSVLARTFLVRGGGMWLEFILIFDIP